MTRRLFFRQTATAATGAAVLGVTAFVIASGSRENQEPQNPLYQSLGRYKDKELPIDLTRKIAKDLIAQTEYPALQISGIVVDNSLDDPRSIAKFDPIFGNALAPIKLEFKDLGNDVAFFRDYGRDRTTNDKLTLTRKDSGQAISFIGVISESNRPAIVLNNALVGAGASQWIYRLMVAKEASHFLYFKAAREKLMDELDKTYQFSHDQATLDALMETAMSAKASSARLRLPSVSPSFDRMSDVIDYAGCGHIVLPLARMRAGGLLSKTDQDILSVNLQGVDDALAQGLITESPNDPKSFEWRIGSATGYRRLPQLSDEWFKVMDDVYKRI